MAENPNDSIRRLHEVAPRATEETVERKGRDGSIRRPNIVPPIGPGGIVPISSSPGADSQNNPNTSTSVQSNSESPSTGTGEQGGTAAKS